MERLRRADAGRYDQVLLRLRRYDQRLGRFGLRDRHLDWQISTRDVRTFAVREAAFGLLLLPLCALGLLLFGAPYQLTGWVATRAAAARDVLATAQVFAGLAIYGAWLGALGGLAWWLGGAAAAGATLLLVPVVAIAALFAIERESAVLDAVRAWWLLRRAHRDTRARLRRRRSELADLLDDVNRCLAEAEDDSPPAGRRQAERG
jgi:hypothetical protein